MANELVVCWTESDLSEDSVSSVVLSDVVSEITTEEELNEWYNRLRGLDVDHPFKPPIYQIVVNQVWGEGGHHEDPPRSMETLIPVYRHIRTCIDSDTEVLRVIGVSGRYLDLLRDLADAEGLQVDVRQETGEGWSPYRQIASVVPWLLLSVVDAFVTLLLRPYFRPTDAEVLVKYPMFRSEVFKPIERRLETPIDRTFTLLTVSYFTRGRRIFNDKDFVPIRCFDTVPGMLSEYWFLMRLCYDIFVGDRFRLAVVDAVEEETGLRLERTAGRLAVRGVLSNLNMFLYYGAANQIADRADYSSVLLTSSGPSGRAIACSAVGETADLFVLPHSIQHQRTTIGDPMYTGIFVEGEITAEVLTRDPERFMPVGLPKHVSIHQQHGFTDSAVNRDRRQLLVGTQPFADSLRRETVLETVPVVLDETDWAVTIKIHPAERKDFYRDLLDTVGINPDEEDRLVIAADNLYHRIRQSDLLVTVNSNVGIESVILGTPIACYNPRPPDIRYPLYAKHGSVPQLQTSGDLIELIEAYDGQSLGDRQAALINGPYNVVGNSLDDIAHQVETALTSEDTTHLTEQSAEESRN